MDAKLVLLGSDLKASEFRLRLPAVLGRGKDATLPVASAQVSRKHCEVTVRNSRLFVRDLGSMNGTFVGNKRVEGEVLLPSGELLTIGNVTFRVEYEAALDLYPPATDEASNSPAQFSQSAGPDASTLVELASLPGDLNPLSDEALRAAADVDLETFTGFGPGKSGDGDTTYETDLRGQLAAMRPAASDSPPEARLADPADDLLPPRADTTPMDDALQAFLRQQGK